MQNRSYIKSAVCFLIGIVLLWIPLLGNFHVESAILASVVGCFWAGWKGADYPNGKSDFYSALTVLGYLYILAFPLFLFSLFSGCFSVHGLGFWLFFPLPSVFLGYAIGRLLRKWKLPARRVLTVSILVLVAIGVLAFEFFNYPQVYFFNHIWGGWPGPIYDETVTMGRSTVFFRSMTLLWAILLWHIPSINTKKFSLWIVILSGITLGFCYSQLAEMGVVSPNVYLQSVLGGSKETAHFKLYYDQESYTDSEITLLAKEQEFYLNQIAEKLDLQADSLPPIESYLYAHPWQKKKLVGAKFTSYVPVWLTQDQLHIAKQQLEGSLKHELVHVLAKQFGNQLFNASWSIGLIEGLAVAVEGGSSSTTTIDQVVVSEHPYPKPPELKQAFSFLGFYGGRSGVNYITSGSFVKYLLDQYPAQKLKEAYRTGSIQTAYRQNWETLTQGWYHHLDTIKTDTVDRKVAGHIFSMPSLFEKKCPHMVTDFAAVWDRYRYSLAGSDTLRALEAINNALIVSDSLALVKAEWSFRQLVAGNKLIVKQAATFRDTTADQQLLYADAFMMDDDSAQAQQHLHRAQELFNRNSDSLRKSVIATRMDNEQWQIYRHMSYEGELPDSVAFKKAVYRTKIRSLRKVLEQENWTMMAGYARQLLGQPIQLRYFDDYLSLIHYLGFQKKIEAANRWIHELEKQPLRDRYKERLEQQKEWLKFLE